MDPFALIPLLVILGFLAALWGTARNWFQLLARHRVVKDIATSKVRSAPQGYVELEGRAANPFSTPLRSPLTGAECLWFHIQVREYVGGKNNQWRTIREDTSRRPLLLTDDTGSCLVDPVGADVTCHHDWVWHGPGPEPAGPPTPEQRNRGFFIITKNTLYEYTEHLVHEGETLYALGRFRSYQRVSEALRQRLRRYGIGDWKRQPEVLVRAFDRNGDGALDLTEWQRVERAAELDVERRIEALAESGQVHLLEKDPDRDRPFMLSTLAQADLASTYQRRTLWNLVILVLMGLLLVTLLVEHDFLG